MPSAARVISAQSPPPQHYLVLDMYRFAAAAGVMLSHYILLMDLRAGTHLGWMVEHLHLLVDFFFILSGFVIALHYDGRIQNARDYAHYMRRRLARIYPLHALTLLATLLIYFAGLRLGLPVRDPARFDMSALPAHITLTQAFGLTQAHTFNVPSWSLSAEFFMYLLFPLLALAVKRSVLLALAGTVIFVAAHIMLRHHLGLGDWTKADFDLGVLRAVPSFVGGIVIARLVRAGAGPALPWTAVLALAVSCIALMLTPTPKPLIIVCLGLLVLLTARAEQAAPVPECWREFFRQLGALSYGVYLWHIVVGTLVITGGARLAGESVASHAWLSLAAMGATVIVAGLGYRYFERPAQKLLQGGRVRARPATG